MIAQLKKLGSNKDGGTLSVFAIALPILIGSVAISVEAGYWVKSKSDVQMIADMASYAGAKELETRSNDEAITAAKLDAINNGYNFDTGTIVVNSPPTTGTYAGTDAVEVIIVQTGLKFFSGVVSNDRIQYRVRSVSALLEDDDICALALNPSATNSMYASGSATLDVQGCHIGSNSTSSSAINFHGSSNITADCLHTAGQLSGGGTVNLACPSAQEESSVIPDPFSYLDTPDLAVAPFNVCSTPVSVGGNNFNMSPGRFCSDMDVKGTYTFAPGTYVLDNADLKFIGGSAALVGSGVTIILMNDSEFKNLNGGAQLTLSPPTTGDYAGVTIFSDPDTQPAGDTLKMNGSSSSVIEGLIYAPNQTIEFGGSTASASQCTLIVGDKVEFSGSSTLEMSGCESNYGLASLATVGTFIVE